MLLRTRSFTKRGDSRVPFWGTECPSAVPVLGTPGGMSGRSAHGVPVSGWPQAAFTTNAALAGFSASLSFLFFLPDGGDSGLA